MKTIMIDADKWELACSLIREVMAWHSDPESSDYNECDKEQCFWCSEAERAMAVDSKPDQ